MTTIELYIPPTGDILSLYQECFDLAALGAMKITRASHVEPDAEGNWWADLTPSQGPKLGPFINRTVAIQAEVDWLESAYLVKAASQK
jgi:hypothetical protein